MDKNVLEFQFGICGQLFTRIVDGVSEKESLMPPASSGNCAHWILGHVLDSRNQFLRVLEIEPLYPTDKFSRYARGSKPIAEGEEVLPFSELVDAYNKMQPLLMDRLAGMDEEAFKAKAPYSPFDKADETVGSLLAFFAFHETYHLGQAALMRRVVGKPGAVG